MKKTKSRNPNRPAMIIEVRMTASLAGARYGRPIREAIRA